MIAALALVAMMQAQAAQEAPVPPAVAEEIRVLAERMGEFKGRVRRMDGAFTCDIDKSTGDAALDDIRCNALRYCAMQVDADVQALADLDLPRRERNARVSELAQSIGPCAEDYEDAVLTRMAWERAG